MSYQIEAQVPGDNWQVDIIDGPRYADGVTWWDVSRKNLDNGGTGWVYFEQAGMSGCSENQSSNPAPAPQPKNTNNQGGAILGDGGAPATNWWDPIINSIVSPVQADTCPTTSLFDEYNTDGKESCTWFVATKRTDVCSWVSSGHGAAYMWTGQARQNGGNKGVAVTNTAAAGDIAVWQPSCGALHDQADLS